MKKLVLVFLFLASIKLISQNTQISGVINSYHRVDSIIRGCEDTIGLNSVLGLSINDVVLIIQMKGANIDQTNTLNFGTVTALNNAGNFERGIIDKINVATNSIVLKHKLLRPYTIGGMVQLIRMPQYTNATITGTLTANPWDQNNGTGGVLAFECSGTLTMNSNIDVSGLGFSGGQNLSGGGAAAQPNFFYPNANTDNALKGEGIAITNILNNRGRGSFAHGGGGGNGHNAGGGGGGNAGQGGMGGSEFNGAATLPSTNINGGMSGSRFLYNNTNRIFLGGGAGAGHHNNNDITGSAGGDGGGIILITANTISGNNQNINSNGSSAPIQTGTGMDGTGGGGAGGSIIINYNTRTSNFDVNAIGGNGGDVILATVCVGPGGGGGGGLIWLSQTPGGNVIFNGGNAGTHITTPACGNWDAGNGNNGTFNIAGFSFPSSDTINSCNKCNDTCNWHLLGNDFVKNNHFIGPINNADFKIRTNNLERMTVEANGNVGIGTDNPSAKLQVSNVNSATEVTIGNGIATSNKTNLQLGTSADANGYTYLQGIRSTGSSYGDIILQPNGGNSSRVGVGVLVPEARFHVNQSGSMNLATKIENGGDGNGLLIESGAGTNQTYLLNATTFATNGNATLKTSRLFVRGDGNIGISRTNPLNRLEINEINNPTDPSSGTIDGGNGNGASGLRFTNLTNQSPFFENESYQSRGVLSVDDQGDVVWIRGGGNGGGINSTCTIQGLIPGVGANGPNLVCSQIYDDVIAGSPNGGGVGINSTGPFFYLAWPGGIVGPNLPPAAGLIALDVNGVTQSLAYIATSDENLKKNIQPIKNANEIIASLNGKTYSWKDEVIKSSKVDAGVHYGFLAQEVEKTMPGAVIKDKNGKYGVEYNAFIPVLVESQKEVIKENEALKTELASLKSDNELMKEKFALLEKTITMLCESGCEGLKKTGEGSSSEVDVLYQSIPNPTDSEALINYYLTREYRDASISVSSQDGKQLKSIKLDAKKGAGSIKLSLGEFANGTYLYTLVAGERVVDTKRLQILK